MSNHIIRSEQVMNTMKEKVDMVPGKRYRGYGFVNEFGEFCFEPEAKGSQAGRITSVVQKDGVSMSYTSRHILLKVKLKRGLAAMTMAEQLMAKFHMITKWLKEYDI